MTVPKLSKTQVAVLAAAIVLMVAGVVLLVIALHPPKTTTKQPHKTAPLAVIQITAAGFVPANLQVASGTKVVWVNEDTSPHLVAADPYPTHTTLPALVAPKALGQKQTYSFVFTKARTVNYHDELNPTWEASITVK
jgi:plastocyanin